jgi:hypothetical protein
MKKRAKPVLHAIGRRQHAHTADIIVFPKRIFTYDFWRLISHVQGRRWEFNIKVAFWMRVMTAFLPKSHFYHGFGNPATVRVLGTDEIKVVTQIDILRIDGYAAAAGQGHGNSSRLQSSVGYARQVPSIPSYGSSRFPRTARPFPWAVIFPDFPGWEELKIFAKQRRQFGFQREARIESEKAGFPQGTTDKNAGFLQLVKLALHGKKRALELAGEFKAVRLSTFGQVLEDLHPQGRSEKSVQHVVKYTN